MKGAVAVTFDFHFSDHVTFQSAHRFWPQLINGGLLLVECRRLHRLTACIRCATLRYAPASLGPRALAGVAAHFVIPHLKRRSYRLVRTRAEGEESKRARRTALRTHFRSPQGSRRCASPSKKRRPKTSHTRGTLDEMLAVKGISLILIEALRTK